LGVSPSKTMANNGPMATAGRQYDVTPSWITGRSTMGSTSTSRAKPIASALPHSQPFHAAPRVDERLRQ
jgi:hypothetical protein